MTKNRGETPRASPLRRGAMTHVSVSVLFELPYDALLNVSELISTVPAPCAGSVVADA
jgi:hypothetical protein